MNVVAAPLDRLRDRARVRAEPLTARRALIAVGALVVVSLYLRTTAVHGRYWIDEGLSVGIASHPFFDIPGLLRQDGAPPLYYLLLHVWTSVFDDGEADTHMLSVLFAVATIPVSFAAGRAIFGLRAGLATALIFAINPFLTFYAQETRMYALLALLSTCVAASFALAFALDRPGWRWAFAAAMATTAYTHNWGLFLGVGTAAALGVLWLVADRERRRAVLRRALPAYGVVALAYLPWVPTLFFQAAHTAAPWSERPPLSALWNTTSSVLGAAAPAMAFALGVLVGFVALLQRGGAGGRLRALSPEGRAALALAAMFVAGLLCAWLASQPNPAWASRYLTVFMGPLFVLAGAALARAGWVGIVVLVLVTAFWLHPRTFAVNNKSDAHHAAVTVAPWVYPGDLVVAAHPEYGPTLHLYLPPGLRWASTLGPTKDPTIFDWRDALERLRATKPRPTADAMVRSLRQGQQLVLVMPIFRTAQWSAPWTSLVKLRAQRWEHLLNDDTRLIRKLALPRLRGKGIPRGVRMVIYERVPDGTGGRQAVVRPDPPGRR